MEREKILRSANLNRIEAAILEHILTKKEFFSREIERDLQIRQPECCVALNEFMDRGWLTYKKIKSEGKGRPQQLYSFKKSKTQVIMELIDNLHEQQKNINKTISALKEWQNKIID